MGIVRGDAALVARYSVTKYHTVMVIVDPAQDKVEKYEGENMGLKALQDFFRPFAYGERKLPKESSFV